MGCGSSTQIESKQATIERRRASAARVPTPVDDGLLAVASTVVVIDYDSVPPPAPHTFDATAQPSQSSLRAAGSTSSFGGGAKQRSGRRSIAFRAVDGSTARLARSPLPHVAVDNEGEPPRGPSPGTIARQLEEAEQLSRVAGDLGFGVVVSPKTNLKSPPRRFVTDVPSPPDSTPTAGDGGHSFESELATRDPVPLPVPEAPPDGNSGALADNDGSGLDGLAHPMDWVHRSNSTATAGSDDVGDGTQPPAAASTNENRSSNALNRSLVRASMQGDAAAMIALSNRRHLEPPPTADFSTRGLVTATPR